MNGEDLGATIRADALHDGTLTVLVTSAGNRGDAARARARGFSAYVSKPLEWDLLARLLIEVRHRAENAPAGTAPALVTLHSMAEAERSRLRILLVEDSAVNQLVTQWTLKRLGYGLHMAATASAALEAWERDPFDLVLLDLRLPDGDGYALARELRSREAPGRRASIVAMTGSAESGERERCLEAGMDEFITKPVDLGLLCNVVERLTHSAPGSAPAAAGAGETRAENPEPLHIEVVADDAPLLREIEAAEADICGLTRSGAGRVSAGSAARPPAAPGHPGRAPGDDEQAEAAEAEAGQRAGPGLDVEMLSSADVEPLTGGPGLGCGCEGPRPALDLERLDQSSMGIPALRASLLGTFLAEARPRLEQLGQAVVAHDARRIEFEAHGLKGMCLTLGADVCAEIFAEMERLGREQQLGAGRAAAQARPPRGDAHRALYRHAGAHGGLTAGRRPGAPRPAHGGALCYGRLPMRSVITPRLALLTTAHFTVDVYSSFFSPLLPLLATRLDMNLATVGTLVALASISSVVLAAAVRAAGRPPAPPLAHRPRPAPGRRVHELRRPGAHVRGPGRHPHGGRPRDLVVPSPVGGAGDAGLAAALAGHGGVHHRRHAGWLAGPAHLGGGRGLGRTRALVAGHAPRRGARRRAHRRAGTVHGTGRAPAGGRGRRAATCRRCGSCARCCGRSRCSTSPWWRVRRSPTAS